VVLIDGLPSADALKRVGDEVPGHKVINLIHGGKTPLLGSRRLHELGFKIVLYSTPALYTAARTMFEEMTKLRETCELESISERSLTFREFQSFIETEYFRRRGSAGLARPDADAPTLAPTAPSTVHTLDAFVAEEGTRSRRLLATGPAETGQA
jgi:hypothetical protein